MPAVFGVAGGTEEEMKADFYCPHIGWPLPSMYISVDIARWSNPHTCSVVGFITWREGGWQCCSFSSVCKVMSSISNTGQVCPLCSKSSKNKTVLAGSRTWIVFSISSWRENGNVFPFFLKKKKIFRFDFKAVSKHGSIKMLFIKSPGQHIPEMDLQVIRSWWLKHEKEMF